MKDFFFLNQVATAVLSITAKHNKKKKAEEASKDKDKMDVDEEGGDSKDSDKAKKEEKATKEEDKTAAKEEDKAKKEEDKAAAKESDGGKAKKSDEPSFSTLANPARVMKPQLRVVSLEAAAAEKYRPVKDVSIGGKDEHERQKIVEFT